MVLGSVQLIRSYALDNSIQIVEGEFIDVMEMQTDNHPIEQFVIKEAGNKYRKIDIDTERIRDIPKTGSKVRIKAKKNYPKADIGRHHVETDEATAPEIEVADQSSENIEVVAPPGDTSTTVDGAQITAEGAEIAAAPVTKNIAVIRVNLRVTDGSTGIDIRNPVRSAAKETELWADPTSPDRFWNAVSYGNLLMRHSVYTVTINITGATTCAANNNELVWLDKADAATTALGVNLGSFTNKYYIFPIVASSVCNYAGKAYVGGNRAWSLFGYEGSTLTNSSLNGTMEHELGHNFGLQHSHAKLCTASTIPVVISGTCTDDEYGDPFSIMGMPGIRKPSLPFYQKNQLGFLPATKIQTITRSGNYNLSPSDSTSTSAPHAQAIRIAIPNSNPGRYFEIEYRAPTTIAGSYTAADKVTQGFSVRSVLAPTTGTNYHSYIYDAKPSTTTFLDAPFRVETFTDPATRTTIRLVNLSSTGMVLNISLNGVVAPLPTTIADNIAPEVTMKAPLPNSRHQIGTPLTLEANVVDNTGAAKVEFYDSLTSALLGTDTTAPFSFVRNTSNADLGMRRFYAVAYDAGGNSTRTAEVAVTIANLTDTVKPTLTITGPTHASVFPIGSTINITADAQDTQLKDLTFNRSDSIVRDSIAPFQVTWNTTGQTAGLKFITVTATDWNGNVSTSTVTVSLTSSTTDTVNPTVALIAPANNTSVSVGSPVSLSATAADNVAITRVDFYSGTALLNTDFTPPYTYSWGTSGQTIGAKTLTAKAFDAAGNTASSVPVTLNLTSTSEVKVGDTNNDGHVNSKDYSVVVYYFGQNNATADLNHDGSVGSADLAILLANWTW
jgi:hypothetical protein